MVNSPLLELLGIDPAIIFGVLLLLIIILLIMLIVAMVKIGNTNRRLDSFMRGKDAESLEETMVEIIAELERLNASDIQKRRDIKRINDNLMITYQKQGIVKYDAFNEMGGKLSFALALLDKNNNGFIINSMHSREGCYTYIKEIVKGESYILLGEEERQALEKAIDEEDLMEDLKEFKKLDEKKDRIRGGKAKEKEE
ncbi:MAG: DUF4446 family protein [Lachnospiraceae bacterium]|nr:DUF4446 family protein [Lachnospiraceae bacterium]MDY5648351.1 DUF4446 family protein [Lachnospiraceae bacterium]